MTKIRTDNPKSLYNVLTGTRPDFFDSLSNTLPTVPPSEMARLWQSNWQREHFSTPEFCGFFGLTAAEAQAILHDYVTDGLLSFAGLENGVETWRPSRDGCTVFRARSKRLTKKEIAQVKVMLENLIIAADVELCIGGRPVFGKPNGTLIIGVKVPRMPYSDPVDGELFSQIYETLQQAGLQSCCSIFFYNHRVPHRLQYRMVWHADKWVPVESAPLDLDLEEKEHFDRFSGFIAAKGVGYHLFPDLGSAFSAKFIQGMPRGTSYYVEDLQDTLKFAIACERSPVVLSGNTALLIEQSAGSWPFDFEFSRQNDFYNGRDTHLLAEADYASATGTFEEYCRTIEDTSGFGLGYADRADLPLMVLGALARWRQDIRDRRAFHAEKRNEKRPPREFRYEAVFDYLNFETPQLVGFMRNPQAMEGGWSALCSMWGGVLRTFKGTAGQIISSIGWCAGAISLYRRPATEEEIEAFDALSKKADAKLKAIFIAGDSCLGLPAKQRYGEVNLGPTPSVLAKSMPPSPVIPKILCGSAWRGGRSRDTIFEHIQKKCSSNTLVRDRLIDAEKVLMSDFVQRGAATKGRDPLVIASGLSEDWTFETTTLGWVAAIDAGEWVVQLETMERQLFLTISLESLRRRITISRKNQARTPAATEYLSALLAFMDQLRSVKKVGCVNWLEERSGYAWGKTREEQFKSLTYLVSRCLTGYYSGSSYDAYSSPRIDWPDFVTRDT